MAELRRPPSSRRIELSTAHNLTDRVIGTWFPGLPRTPRVMVPIQLDALVVRSAGAQWANCRMKIPLSPSADSAPVDTRPLLPKPFENLSESRPPGVYLHWALPDALTRGINNATNETVDFPAIPDRWLVVRLQ